MLRARFKDGSSPISEAGSVAATVKSLDMFDKVERKYAEPTAFGGFVSLLMAVLVVYLVVVEIAHYRRSKFVFRFSPDTLMDDRLTVRLDLTVATPCSMLGTDADDRTSDVLYGNGELHQEDDWFDLDDSQRLYFDSMKYINTYLREEYHAVSDLLWRSGEAALSGSMPDRRTRPSRAPDACRIRGELTVNKVAGEIWIAGGKTLGFAGARIFIGLIASEGSLNMSHRIYEFAFGESAPGIVHPLEGYEMIAKEPTRYDYFIEVVPTEIDTLFSKTKTCQYSLREHARSTGGSRGSAGTSGIFFQYDMSALKLSVSQERDNIVQFTVRLFSIIGGVYLITAVIHAVLSKLLFNHKSEDKPI